MPPFGPIGRMDLVRALHRAGFDGPHFGKKHQIMRRLGGRVRIPNPHQGDISKQLLSRILREAGITREEWEKL
jgi:predicted RNA binding protein YcfA (HicA-like mRNA interferase family)